MSVYDYSDPAKVFKKAHKMGIENIEISNRKDKKYKVYDGKRWVHFGQLGYEDFTKHKDTRRQNLFKTRNARWADAEPMTPAFLSYYLLW